MTVHPAGDGRRGLADDREFWLGHCEGFEVCAGDRHVGVVEYVRYGSSHDRPDALYARCGSFRARVLEVPVSDVEDLDPPMETLWISETLASSPGFARSGVAARVREGAAAFWSGVRSGLRRAHEDG
jgi:hypothetical protein